MLKKIQNFIPLALSFVVWTQDSTAFAQAPEGGRTFNQQSLSFPAPHLSTTDVNSDQLASAAINEYPFHFSRSTQMGSGIAEFWAVKEDPRNPILKAFLRFEAIHPATGMPLTDNNAEELEGAPSRENGVPKFTWRDDLLVDRIGRSLVRHIQLRIIFKNAEETTFYLPTSLLLEEKPRGASEAGQRSDFSLENAEATIQAPSAPSRRLLVERGVVNATLLREGQAVRDGAKSPILFVERRRLIAADSLDRSELYMGNGLLISAEPEACTIKLKAIGSAAGSITSSEKHELSFPE